jgi:drug/metabolite transporter (DMT)-like permease
MESERGETLDGGSVAPGGRRILKGDMVYLAPLLLATLIAGTTPIAAKYATAEISPFSLGFLRFGIAALLLLAVLLIRGERFDFSGGDRWRILWLGLLVVPINQPLFLIGTHKASAGHSGLVYALTPVFVLLLAAMMGMEKITRRKIVGVILSFGGIAAIIAGAGVQFSPDFLLGDLMLLGAVFSWSLYVVGSKPLIARHGALRTLTAAFLIGVTIYAPVFLWDMHNVEWSSISTDGWIGALYISLVTSFLGYFLWNWLLSRIDASKASTINNLAPIVTILLGVLLLDEPLTLLLVLGGLTTILGVAITQRG